MKVVIQDRAATTVDEQIRDDVRQPLPEVGDLHLLLGNGQQVEVASLTATSLACGA